MTDITQPSAGGGSDGSPASCDTTINVDPPGGPGGNFPPITARPLPIPDLPPEMWLPPDIDPRLPPGFGDKPILPIRNPGNPGFGYVPISELPGLIGDLEDPDRVEQWDEVDRTTSTIDVSGVTIERIESVTFQKQSGAKVVLNFNN